MKKYYSTLELDETASEQDIKRAYRKLASKYHPDKNLDKKDEAEARFKEINEAYEVLSDPQKKQQYDQLGDEGFAAAASGGGAHFTNPFQFFEQMFGGAAGDADDGGGFGASPFSFLFGGGGGMGGRERREDDIVIRVPVTLKNLYCSDPVTIDYDRTTFCASCAGAGTKNGKKAACAACQGNGRVKVVKQMGMMIQQMVMDCGQCRGSGRSIERGNECGTCSGNGLVKERVTASLTLERGMAYSRKVVLSTAGNRNAQGKTGRVYAVIDLAPQHNEFELREQHLFRRIKISLENALLGFTLNLKYIDDQMITVTRKGVTQPGSVLVVSGLGFDRGGDLYLHVQVELPETVPRALAEKITNIYGKTAPTPIEGRTYVLEKDTRDGS